LREIEGIGYRAFREKEGRKREKVLKVAEEMRGRGTTPQSKT